MSWASSVAGRSSGNGASAIALLAHQALELGHIHRQPALTRHEFGEIQREPLLVIDHEMRVERANRVLEMLGAAERASLEQHTALLERLAPRLLPLTPA
mgnify:CR=1 FL=1